MLGYSSEKFSSCASCLRVSTVTLSFASSTAKIGPKSSSLETREQWSPGTNGLHISKVILQERLSPKYDGEVL